MILGIVIVSQISSRKPRASGDDPVIFTSWWRGRS